MPDPLPQRPDFLGPILLILLGLAVTIALGLALQFDNDRARPEPLHCDRLYASLDEECCEDWVENWAPCRIVCDEPNRGLFDAEERFATDEHLVPDC